MDKFKELFTGKKKYFMFAGLGLILLLVFLRPKSSSTSGAEMEYLYSGATGAGGGGSGGLSTTDVQNIVDNAVDLANNESARYLNEMLSQQQSSFDKSFSQFAAAFETQDNYYRQTAAQQQLLYESQMDALSKQLAEQMKKTEELIFVTEKQIQFEGHYNTGGGALPAPDASGQMNALTQQILQSSKTDTIVRNDSKNQQAPVSNPITQPVTQAPANQNQITYLTNLKATGTSGQSSWANQALYLENLTNSGTAGEKAWAASELKKLYGK